MKGAPGYGLCNAPLAKKFDKTLCAANLSWQVKAFFCRFITTAAIPDKNGKKTTYCPPRPTQIFVSHFSTLSHLITSS